MIGLWHQRCAGPAKADLGMAIGAGTDVAIESADAVLMRSDLLDAVSAIRLSKAVIKNIKEKPVLGLLHNVICIPRLPFVLYPALASGLNPMIPAPLPSLSGFTVCMNCPAPALLQDDGDSTDVSRNIGAGNQ